MATATVSIALTHKQDSFQNYFPDTSSNNCLTCHNGIEQIRDPESGMMKEIYQLADKAGIKDNECIVCHGGNPTATGKEEAHSGSVKYFIQNKGPVQYYPDPASVWIND